MEVILDAWKVELSYRLNKSRENRLSGNVQEAINWALSYQLLYTEYRVVREMSRGEYQAFLHGVIAERQRNAQPAQLSLF